VFTHCLKLKVDYALFLSPSHDEQDEIGMTRNQLWVSDDGVHYVKLLTLNLHFQCKWDFSREMVFH
jgi:hypothetical protein